VSDDLVARTPFVYDALRKVAVARTRDRAGGSWVLEFVEHRDDDSRVVVVRAPDGATRTLTVTDTDFEFAGETVTVRGLEGVVLTMPELYARKLRGFTRGNVPTPDVAGPSLP
jgi:hypothetical protein